MSKIKFAYFGGEPLGVPVLEKLKQADLIPEMIVCNPNRPSGRGQQLTPPPVKVWATTKQIDTFQPQDYKDGTARERLEMEYWDLFIVVAYNFILPKWLLKLPRHGVINIHPSLLPKLRGASPIRSAILRDEPKNIGVTVMLMDEEMDHGPILEQETLSIKESDWPMNGSALDTTLATMSGKLLTEVIPAWIQKEIAPQEQDHEAATYCGRLQKTDRELVINPFQLPVGEAAWQSWLKINAFAGIGDTFFVYNSKRVKVKKAVFSDNQLHLLRVIPEGKKEMDFADYLQSIATT